MKKRKSGTRIIGFPMPVTLVGTVVDSVPNFMAVSWVSRTNVKPPMIAISINKNHHTVKGILEHRQFSVCTPGKDLLIKTDFCGIKSGKSVDKSNIFSIFWGDLEYAPMIEECPVCLECSLNDKIELPDHYLFIATIVESYADEVCLTEGKPDLNKIKPFLLSLPDRHYWAVGEEIAKAYKEGLNYKLSSEENVQ